MNSSEIKNLSNQELLQKVTVLVRKERELVEHLLWHLQEVQSRKLYLDMGFTSLYECLVKHFKYSEAVAYSRISALRIINAVPEASHALKAGEVSVTTLSLTQSFIRKQEKQRGAQTSLKEKNQVLELVKNRSTQEVKQTLATLAPVAHLPTDKVQYLSETHLQLQVTLSKATLEKLSKLKSLISHQNIDPTYEELLNLSLDAAILSEQKKRGLLNPSQTVNQPTTTTQSFSIKSSRYISRSIKRQALNRSQARCQHQYANGQQCNSQFQLQFDHVQAFSKGGSSLAENIQVLCRVHNSAKGNKSAG